MNYTAAVSGALLLLSANTLFAKAVVSTPANATLSASTAGGAYVSLSGPALDEGANRDIGAGTIILNVPAGFAFDPTALVTASVSRLGGTGTLLALTSSNAVVTTTTITITVATRDASSSATKARITWTGIRVRPTAGTPLAVGNITRSGTATINSITTSTSFGLLTETAGTATQMAFTTQPGGAVAGASFGTQPVIKTQDQFGNNSTNGLPAINNVTLGLSSGTGPLQGNPTFNIGMAGGKGTAAYSGLRIDVAGVNQQLGASSGSGLPAITSALFTVSPGPASTLVIGPQPSASATAGTPFTQQPVVLIEDAYNNLCNTDSLAVTATPNAGAGALLGTASLAAVGGVATFTNLAEPKAGSVTLSFASGSLTPAVSGSIAVSAGPLSQLQVLLPGETAAPGTPTGKTGTPTSETVGSSFNITVSSVDAWWNPVGASDTVSLSCTDPSATLPAAAPLVTGSRLFPVTNYTVGAQTLTAVDVTQPSVHSGTTAPFMVASTGTVAGPVLPPQANRVINELTILVVTNTATDANLATNVPASGALVTNTILFTYTNRTALLADGWSFWATNSGVGRNTEITDTNIGPLVIYNPPANPGVLRIPCDIGDLWDELNDTRNSLFRAVSTNWVSMVLSVAFNPTLDVHQTHLGIYQDDDNYLDIGLAFNSGLGGEVMTFVLETSGNPSHFYAGASGVTNLLMRMDQDITSRTVKGLYSFDRTNWLLLGTWTQPFASPRLILWTGSSALPYTAGSPNADLRQLNVTVSNNVSPLGLTYALVDPPAGATIDANGIITWTPAEAQGPSTNILTTVVTDNNSPPLSATNSFTVVVNEVNQPPVLPTQPNQTIIGQTALVVANTATDPDMPSNPLTYQLTVAPTNALIDTNGIINWTPAASQVPSTYTFTTVVTDYNPWAVNNQHLSATNSFLVFVLAAPPPNGPVLPAQPNQMIIAQTTLVVTNTAADAALGVTGLATNTVFFTYTNRAALLADGWSFWATNNGVGRNTEVTDTNVGPLVIYNPPANPGVLRIPCDIGDLWGDLNDTRNSLFRAVSSNWVSAQLALAFAPVTDTQQAHLTVYQDDDNYVQVGVAYNGARKTAMDLEVGGSPSTLGAVSISTTNLHLRLDRNPVNGRVTALYSLDGAAWVTLNQAAPSFVNPRLCIWVGGSQTPYAASSPNCDLQRLDILLTNNAAPAVVAYQLISPPTGAAIDTNGIITWTPTLTQAPSTNVFTTIATDNEVPPLSATNSFLVIVNSTLGPAVVVMAANTVLAPPGAVLTIDYSSGENSMHIGITGTPSRTYEIQWSRNVRRSLATPG